MANLQQHGCGTCMCEVDGDGDVGENEEGEPDIHPECPVVGHTRCVTQVPWCVGALYYTHIASSPHVTWKLISAQRYEIICV